MLLELPKIVPTKADIQRIGTNILELFKSGDRDNLLLLADLKAFESLLKETFKSEEIKQICIKEAEKHGEKTFTYKGVKFQLKESPEWDYSATNDLEVEKLAAAVETAKEAVKKAEEKLKDRQTFLQNDSLNRTEIYNEEGVRINQATKTSKTVLAVTIQ